MRPSKRSASAASAARWRHRASAAALNGGVSARSGSESSALGSVASAHAVNQTSATSLVDCWPISPSVRTVASEAAGGRSAHHCASETCSAA